MAFAWALADLVEHSAGSHDRAGEGLGAQRQWVRVLAIWRRVGDPRRVAVVCERLGWLYVECRRPHKALDAFVDARSSWQRLDCEPAALRAQYSIGVTMLLAGRPDAAAHYLPHAPRRADRAASAIVVRRGPGD